MSEEADLVELLVPNFLSYLGGQGEVEISDVTLGVALEFAQLGKKPLPMRPWIKESSEDGYHIGTRYLVLLDGEMIGVLEVFEEPDAFYYEGRVPGFDPQAQVPDKEGDYLWLSYHREHPNAMEEGRGDCWDIPFP